MVVSYAQRSTLTALDELVCAVRAVVDRHADWRRTARLVARTLERHLPSPEILTDEQRTSTNGAGDASGLAPPGDIHRVRNAGDETAISIHVYGTDVSRSGSSVRRYYDQPVVCA
jgi:hypothetical protein